MAEPAPQATGPGLLTQLRQRRVLRVLAVYLVGAWLALQVSDVALLPALGIPDVGMRYLVIAAAVGLVVALVLSWRFDITAQGIVPHSRKDLSPAQAATLSPADRSVIFTLTALVLIAFGATSAKLFTLAGTMDAAAGKRADDPPPAAPGSLAVLPFANLSDDPQLEYLGDGLAEELLNRLSTVPSLLVTARTSAFSLKGRDMTVQQIGDALGVQYVLEGSVRRSGDALRVAVQLIDTENGYRVWSNTYDRHLVDVFAIQDEIAQIVIGSLRVVLTPQQEVALTSHGTQDPQVLDLYLRARYLYQRMDVVGLETGIRHLRDVIERDPSYAAAYVALADALDLQRQIVADFESADSGDAASEHRRLLDTAIALDPSNADAHAKLGATLSANMDLDGARRELAIAERLNPNAELFLRYAGQFYGGMDWPPEKGIGYTLRGVQLDPLNPWAITNLAIAYYHADQFEQSLQALDRVHELNPSFWVAWWQRDYVLLELRRYEEAVEAARRALEFSGGYVDINADLVVVLAAAGYEEQAARLFRSMEDPNRRPRWRPGARAFALAGLGRYEEAMDAIEEAVRVKDGFVIDFFDHRLMLPLHQNPRFKQIVSVLEQDRRVERLRRRVEAESKAE